MTDDEEDEIKPLFKALMALARVDEVNRDLLMESAMTLSMQNGAIAAMERMLEEGLFNLAQFDHRLHSIEKSLKKVRR